MPWLRRRGGTASHGGRAVNGVGGASLCSRRTRQLRLRMNEYERRVVCKRERRVPKTLTLAPGMCRLAGRFDGCDEPSEPRTTPRSRA